MGIPNLSDAQLIEALKEGSEAAMTEIYHRYWRKLLAITYNHTKDKSSAQEIVQEILIRLWDRRCKLEITSLNNYLATSVRYAVYNFIYREKRRSQIASENFAVNDMLPDDEYIYAQFLQQHINDSIELLPDKCKLVFKYSRFQGKSIPEISHEMEISEKTVEAHLTKALKSLKLSLKHGGWLTILLLFYFR